MSMDDLKSPIAMVGGAVVALAIGLFLFLHGRVEAAAEAEEGNRHMKLLEQRHEDTSRESIMARSQSRPNRFANAYDGGIGFVVPYRPDCPRDSERRGDVPPRGFKEWCERDGIKHGWYAEFYEDGRPKASGEFREGLRTGVWTRWYENGVKRVQAEFENGLQHGRLISWNERGQKLGEQRFEEGQAVASRH